MSEFLDKITPRGCVFTTVPLMRKAEKEAMENETTEAELIERASDGVVKVVLDVCKTNARIAIFVGCGNNGSDGLSTAIKLKKKSINCSVFYINGQKNKENERLTKEAEECGVPLAHISLFDGEYDLVLDCVFGIGLNRAPSGECAEAIRLINAQNCVKIAVDVPSGLDASKGVALGDTVVADYTVSLGAIKIGQVLGDGLNYCGKIIGSTIGVNANKVATLVDENLARIDKRMPASHKGSYGKISVIGGSDTMPGAPLMTYESALASSKCGAGLVRLCVGESEKCAYKARVTEQTLFYLPDQNGFISYCREKLDEIMEWSDVVAIGMGMGSNPNLPKILRYLLDNYQKTLVIDADGINAVSKFGIELAGAKCRVILTPHVGEFARLCPDVEPTDVEGIMKYARENRVTIAVKSAVTVITDGQTAYLNATGTPAMAKGGSGDVLAGMASAFAVSSDPLSALIKACYYFGKCGERAEKRLKSQLSVLASDIIVEQAEIFN